MTNKSLPSTNLASAFAKPDRAAGIRLPSAKKATTAPQRPVQPVPDPEPTPAPKARQKASEAPQSAPQGAKAPRKPKKRAPVITGRLVLWSPVTIRTRMQAHRAATGKRYVDQVLDALEATVDDLPNLLDQASRGRQHTGRLFEREEPANPDTPVKVQLTITGFADSQLSVIDQLVDDLGTESRSALINTALDAHLPAATSN